MTTNDNEDFQSWLNSQLKILNTDEGVFGSYILGILEGDETEEEKLEALEGILTETGAPNIDELISTILNKWYQCHPKDAEPPKKGLEDIDVNAQLAKLLEKQKIQPTVKEREYTEEEQRIKDQILAQYSQTAVSDDDDDVSDDDADKQASTASTSLGFEPNTNKSDVLAMQRERREQARLDSAAKKQKDKEDREKQKQLREEKKEKRKTVKGERRR